jgi:hypothetical protein
VLRTLTGTIGIITSDAAPRVDRGRATACFALFLPVLLPPPLRETDGGVRFITSEPGDGRSDGILPPIARGGVAGAARAAIVVAAFATSARATLPADMGDEPGEKDGHKGDSIVLLEVSVSSGGNVMLMSASVAIGESRMDMV